MLDGLISNKENFSKDIIPFMAFRTEGIESQPVHSHEYIQMWYVVRGTCEHYYEGQTFQMGQGSLFLIPPYLNHAVSTPNSPDSILITCEFSEDFINESTDGDMKNTLFNLAYLEPLLIHCKLSEPSLHFTGETAAQIECILEELLVEYQKQEHFYSLLIRANVFKLLALIARQFELDVTERQSELFAKYRDAMDLALRYIDEYFMEKIYLEDVCKMALMSPSSFSYIFRQSTGSTFTEYLQHKRILRSKELLGDRSRSIVDIGLECGFQDAAYFNRVFKKTLGLSPGQYRKLSDSE